MLRVGLFPLSTRTELIRWSNLIALSSLSNYRWQPQDFEQMSLFNVVVTKSVTMQLIVK